MDINIENLKEFLVSKGINEEEIAPFLNNIESKLTKKYGLVWEDKEEDVYNELLKSLPILKEVEERKINTDDNKPVNMLIEGDNLHSLKSLQYTHKGAIQVAYLDPPYNTGNKDFIYNDRYVDKEDTWRHSSWLSFMDKRLRLVKELLADDGVIFISIDDNEQAQLKLLCDEIFGEKNFIQNFLWNKSSGGSSLSRFTRNDYEYILCYGKNLLKCNFEFFNKYSEGMGDSSLTNAPNKYSKLTFKKGIINFIKKEEGIIKAFKSKDLELINDISVKNGQNLNDIEIKAHWKWSQEYLDGELKLNTKIISKSDALRLRYIKNNKGSVIKPTKSITSNNNVGYTVTGSAEIATIFGYKPFDFPKPISLISYLIKMITYQNKNAAVLDCFAGSGTTGHAVLDLNKEDGGNRQFILCTNNENNICEEVTYQRLNKVINGYTTPKGKEVEGLGGNLNYYKVELKESLEDEDDNIENIINDCTDLIAIKENAFTKKEVNAEYDILTSDDKVVMIYKNVFATSQDVLKASSKLKRYKKSNKVIYALNTSIEIDGIDVREFPIEIINKVKTRK